jgi:UDP-N-acetylmuramyl pentapeptide synthase
VRLVASIVRPGDAVLVKGSRALGLERVAEGLRAQPGCGKGDRS